MGELSIWAAVAAGALQGLLEWLPVSSSGQLTLLLSRLAGIPVGEAYGLSIASHLGTAASGGLVARRELLDAARLGPWARIVLVPLAAGAPVGLLVSTLLPSLPGDLLNAMIGVLLVATALIVWRLPHRGGRRASDLSTLELAFVGVLQGLAALPGLSRSAVTLAGLLYLGLDPAEAARASIAMGTAATGAYAVYELTSGTLQVSPALAAMLASSFAFGLLGALILLSVADRLRDSAAAFAALVGLLALASGVPAIVK